MINFLPATIKDIDGSTARVAHPALVGGDVRVSLSSGRTVGVGSPVTLGLRPEHLVVGGAMPLLTVTADFAENLGGATQIYATAPDSPTITVMIGGRHSVTPGETLPVSLGSGQIYAFDEAGLAL
jgi:ABC-type sugar transport system ATPase subunit